LHLHTCVYIICTTFILLPLSPTPPTPQILFCPPVLWFCRRKNIKDKKRNMAFLLVWDKGSYTRRFLVLFPCIYVLQSQLVHLYQSSSLHSSPLPMVAPTSLKFLYSLLYREHINHIQVFSFLPFSYPSCAWPPLNVTHVP
jgi:hypothetical protein